MWNNLGNKKTFLCRWELLLMKLSAVLKRISLGKCSPPSRLHEPQKTSWILPSSMDPGSEAIQQLCKQSWRYTGSVPCHNIPMLDSHLSKGNQRSTAQEWQSTYTVKNLYELILGLSAASEDGHISAMARLSWGALSCQPSGHGGRYHLLSHVGQMWNTCNSAGAG